MIEAVQVPPRDPGALSVGPAAGWASGPLGVVQAADREIARLTAVRARAVAAFAGSRPASGDRQPGDRGAMSAQRRAARPQVLAEVSEWAANELSIASAVSKQSAGQRLERSLTLVQKLPGTLAALESGLLHEGHLYVLLERVAGIADDARRASLEGEALAWVAARTARGTVTTPTQLAARLRRIGLGRDPRQEAQDLLAAVKERGVWARPDRRAGMGVLQALLTGPVAEAVVDALGRYADALDEPDDRRTRGEKMTDVLADLVLRPGESQLAPVQARLTVVAGVRTLLGGSAPGEVAGEPVPAELVRALAHALGLLDDSAVETASPIPARAPDPAAAALAELAGALDEDSSWAVGGDDLDAYGPEGAAWPAERWAAWEAAQAEDDARALAGVWGGCPEEPPPAVQQRFWDQQRPWEDVHVWNDPSWDEEFERIVAGQDDLSCPDSAEGTGTGDDADDARADDARADDAWPAAPPPDPLAATPAGVPLAGAPPDAVVDPPPGDPSGAEPGGSPDPDPDRGYWLRAHGAVEQAGQALLDFHRAVSRAAAAVGDAERADRADERAWLAGGAGRVDAATSDLDALCAATGAQRAQLAALLQRSAGGTLADRPRIALVDELTGALLALTDAAGLRRAAHCGRPACVRRPHRCRHDLSGRPGLGPPPSSPGHDAATDLDRFVRARDRRCRFPGCRRPVRDLDHNVAYPDGPTSAANLEGFCTGDHRGKHQAPGWTYHLDPDTARLTVTTPSGLTATTDPPPF